MKILKLSAIIGILFLFGILSVNAQDDMPKYGNDSVLCIEKLSLYDGDMKMGDFKSALESWRYVFNECPKATVRIYIDGVKIMKHFIDKKYADDTTGIRDAYIDTLMMVYDQRVEYFKISKKGVDKEGYIRGRQGVDFFKYKRKVDKIIKS